MRRLRFGLAAVAGIFSLFGISACGGHSQPGISPFPAKVTITPTPSTSVQLGTVFAFIASAQNSSNNNVSTTFTFQSSDTSIVNVAPNGVACAGHWDVAFTVCTPGAIGVAKVTATALGANSPPTYVFVHPPIDNVQVNGVLLTNVPIQEPCLSQGQTMTVEAHAYNQGSDITASVGPFTWTANNLNVVKITPLVNQTGNPPYPFATNQATVAAVNPGITQIYATASGTTSTTFYQPQYQNAQGVTSPPLDFFETCLIQNIALEVGPVGSQTNQTSFITGKGAAQNINAVITDVMGNNSLPTDTPITLSKIPLTWTSSNPGALTPPAGCTGSCSIGAPSPGSASITASCSPPTCNIGYPIVPVALSSPQALAACESFFHLTNCEQFIPLPVYSSPLLLPKQTIPVGPAAISGLVTGATGATSVLATSNQCQHMNPLDCTVGLYSVSTNRNVAGSATALPNPLNSLLFDLNGDKAYMGSETTAASINPANVGTGSGAFNSIGSVTGNVLAVSNNGNMAIFSDTQLTPNQVFVVNSASAGAPSVIALNIQQASAAAFTPDGLKAYIFGLDSNSRPALFIYSTLQGLQTITPAPPVGTTVNAIAFSANGAFTYVVEPSLAGGGPAVSVYNNCVRTGNDPNIVADTVKLTAPPVAFKPLADGIHFIALENNGFDYITTTFTGILPATLGNTSTSLCPVMTETNTVQNINLNLGNIDPINFFPSADGSQVYILAGASQSVFVYNFLTGATPGITLADSATPVSGFMTADAGTIVIAGSDNKMHIVTTANGGSDLNPPITFPDLPNYLNPFCTATPSTGPCIFNLLAVKP